eukprot:3191353-Rhodomonas_salina.1
MGGQAVVRSGYPGVGRHVRRLSKEAQKYFKEGAEHIRGGRPRCVETCQQYQLAPPDSSTASPPAPPGSPLHRQPGNNMSECPRENEKDAKCQ